MKSVLPLLSAVVLLASCTTSYKAGQTPDDVYYSPARPQAEYVTTEDKEERRYRNDDSYSYEDERYLRYKVRNRSRWSYLDDYYSDPYAYRYDRYRSYSPYYSNYYDYRNYWNYYYNPYGTHVIVTNPKAPVYSRPRTYNLHVFDNPVNSSVNPKLPNSRTRQYDNMSTRGSNPSRNTGSDLRRVFGTDNSSTQRPPSNPPSRASSSDNNNSSSNSSGSKSSGNAPVRKF